MQSAQTVSEIPKQYEPKDVEARWVDRWESLGVFHANVNSERTPFVIACPPPNVTGALHLGHAVNGTIQDILARQHRMLGDEVLWQPGTDHAGIATQFVVEKKLYREERKTRHDLGRDEFVSRIWDWKQIYGDTILGQYRRLGASLDYKRWRFTMDEGYSKAVRRAFVRLYERGFVYRGNRMINWCPSCLTSLSDLEVSQVVQDDKLYFVAYPLLGEEGELVVATVRPETMLGDVAVAVNPNDTRYAGWVGRQVQVPLADRAVPIIADEHVEMDFGTGALKITPAHDMNDYEIGLRHGLPVINTLSASAILNESAGQYAGLTREEARRRVVADLENEGWLRKIEDYQHSVGHCSRCDAVVEPYLSDQWFVRMAELAKPAIAAVEDGRIQFHPARWGGVYLDWMRQVRDWNISRQLWWGHQIPVWTCSAGHQTVVEETPRTCAHCDSQELVQDPDVLDTWFSSALWTFATQGWPEQTAELKYFHPTSVLSTARDIIYLWVARMIFSSLEFLDDIPFRDVIIHATILDPEGRRMSKSKGTGVDPLLIMDKYGTDACRFWMAGAGTSAQDVRFREEKIESYRNFANKLWNASRFVMMKAVNGTEAPQRPAVISSVIDRWILSRLTGVVRDVSDAIARYEFGVATQVLYEFTWNHFCDWYLELAKPRLDSGDESVRWVLKEVLDTLLRLLHPFMPFITEEIYQLLAQRGWVSAVASLQQVAWPQPQAVWQDEAAERDVSLLIEIVRTVRNMRAELRIEPAKLVSEMVILAGADERRLLEEHMALLAKMTRCERWVFIPDEQAVADLKCATGLAGVVRLYLPLTQFGDLLDKEIARLRKELNALESERLRVDSQLANDAFAARAPVAVVQKLRDRSVEIVRQLEVVQQTLARWEGA